MKLQKQLFSLTFNHFHHCLISFCSLSKLKQKSDFSVTLECFKSQSPFAIAIQAAIVFSSYSFGLQNSWLLFFSVFLCLADCLQLSQRRHYTSLLLQQLLEHFLLFPFIFPALQQNHQEIKNNNNIVDPRVHTKIL